MLYKNIIKSPKPVRKIKIDGELVLDEVVEIDPEEEERIRQEEEEKRKREEFEQRVEDEVEAKIQTVLKEQEKELAEKYEKEKAEQYKSGFEEGKIAGIEEGKENIKPSIEDFAKINKNILDEKELLLHNAEKDVISLCYLIAKKIIKKEIEKDDKIILNIVRDALNYISNETSVILKLNPKDYDIVKDYEDEFAFALSDIKNFKFEANEKITRGGYLIETDSGEIDARLEIKISELEKLLMGDKNIE